MSCLINQKEVRRYIKERFASTRPHLKINRVSAQALQDVESLLRVMINKAVHSHPSVGKTFMYCQ